MLLVAPSPTSSPTIVVIEHMGWDSGTTISVVAAVVALLALVLNFLTIPKGRLWLDLDPAGGALWMYNLGDGDAFQVFYRVVPADGPAPAWEPEGIVAPYRSSKVPGLRFTLKTGERFEVRYSVAPLHWLTLHKSLKAPKKGPPVAPAVDTPETTPTMPSV